MFSFSWQTESAYHILIKSDKKRGRYCGYKPKNELNRT